MNKNKLNSSTLFLIVVPIIMVVVVVVYYTIPNSAVRLIALIGIILLVITMITVIYDSFLSVSSRLRRKLAAVASSTTGDSIDNLKRSYADIYHIYSRLSERHKQNFYAQVTGLRERIERKMKADKKMELLIQNIGKGSLQEQKDNYLQMHEIYRRLPEPMQQKYYAHLVHARNLLEKKD